MAKGPNDKELLAAFRHARFDSFVRFVMGILLEEVLGYWHIDVMAAAVSRMLRGKTGRLILNAPPNNFDLLLISVALIAFMLAKNPKMKIVVAAGNHGLVQELHDWLLRLLTSDRYRALNPRVEIEDKTKTEIRTSQGGRAVLITVGQRVPVRGADLVVVYEPQTGTGAASPSEQKEVGSWVDGDLLARLAPTGVAMMAMPRLAIGDLVDHVAGQGWDRLTLKAIAEDDEPWTRSDETEFHRRKGQALCPARQSKKDLLKVLETIGAMNFSAQYQQSPLQSKWITGRYFTAPPPDMSKWVPEDGLPHSGDLILSQLSILRHSLFGVGEPPPRPYEELLSDEQWQAALILQQRRLIASLKEDRD